MQLIVFFYELAFVYWIWQTPESPSWLILKGRYKEEIKVLTAAIEMNKKGTKEDVERKIVLLKNRILADEKERKEEAKKTLLDVWKSPILLKYCLTLYVMSFCMSFTSYGMGYNAKEVYGSLYIASFINAFFSVIKHLSMFSIVNHINRKPLGVSFAIAGSLVLLLMIPASLGNYSFWYLMVFGVIGKFLLGIGFNTVGLLRSEIFPTGIRQLAAGSCSGVGRVGSILAPFVKELIEITAFWVPIAIFGAMGCMVGLLILTLPETKNRPLPETIREAENQKV